MLPAASLPSLLHQRATGESSSIQFSHKVLRKRTRRSLLTAQNIVAPGTTIVSTSDLDIDGRFLLAGRRNGSVLLYDLSRWGGQLELDGKSCSHYPVGEAPRVVLGTSPQSDRDQHRILLRPPKGHSAEVSRARWYPADSGAFLTASKDGNLLVWDSHEMTPVIHYTPFGQPRISEGGAVVGIDAMDVSHRSCYSVALASRSEATIKLVDIRSGASSHTLTGHARAVFCLQWSPSSDYVLASGGLREIRLWDIRKAGSLSCITTLNQQMIPDMTLSRPWKPDYAHLREPSTNVRLNNKRHKVAKAIAPNDYGKVQNQQVSSTDRPVYNLAFDPTGSYLITHDGTLGLWDLRDGQGGFRVPRRFVTANGSTQLLSRGTGTVTRIAAPRTPPLCVTSNDGNLHAGATIWTAFESTLVSFATSTGSQTKEQTLVGHIAPVQSIAAASNSNLLVSTGQDGLILLWDHVVAAPNKLLQPEQDKDDWF